MLPIKEILNEYKIKTELHAHTTPVSKCSHIPPESFAEVYMQSGCSAALITNHLNPDWIGRSADEYLDDYYRAKKRGDEIGINIILGVEIRFTENINDYLVYGVEPSDVSKMMTYLDKGLEPFYKEFKREDNLIIHAHPFRKGMTLMPLEFIDGIESFNLHHAHNSKVAVAARFARENSLLVTGGSDYHDPDQHALCLMRSKETPKDSHDIVKILNSRDYLFDASGSLILPYGY